MKTTERLLRHPNCRISGTVTALACLLAVAAWADLPIMYTQDFSADPGWTTDDPAKLRWDSASGTFHGTQVNTEGTYAFIDLPDFNPNKSWRLEWDQRISSAQWSSGVAVGLFDHRLSYPYGAGVDTSVPDNGHGTGLWANGGGPPGVFSPAWSMGVWYRHVLAYDGPSGQLTLVITNLGTGIQFMNLSTAVSSFPATTTRLGVSRVNVKGNAPGVNPSATVDYNLDNIRLYQASDLPLVYSEDFSAAPGWTTDDSSKLRWDSVSGTFHGTQVNSEGTYANINLPAFNPNGSWRLEWENRINSSQWSSGVDVGLFDDRKSYPYGAGVDMSISDNGHGTGLWANTGGPPGVFSPAWSTDVWYRHVLA